MTLPTASDNTPEKSGKAGRDSVEPEQGVAALSRTQAALEESETRYRLLFDAIDDGFCTFEMIFDEAGKAVDFRYIDANRGFEKQTGRRPRSGQTMRELFPEEEHMWLDLYAKVAHTGEAQRFVDYVGGLDRWYSVYVFPIDPSGGSRLGALFTDVTEAKQAEQALRTSEAKFRTVFDSIDEGFAIVEIIYDRGGETVDIVFREVNHTFERQTGISGVISRSMYDVVPGFEEHWLEPYKRVAATGEPQRVENYQRDLDRWFDVYFTRLDDQGRFVATVFNDISQRKRSEQALRESEGRLARALEAGELGAWELDLATLEAWRSPQHDRIFGYDRLLPEWTYDTFLSHLVPEDRPWVDARFQDAIATGGHWDFECRIRRADGELRWIWAQGRVDPHPEGQSGRMKGMVRDVTERKGSELALRESEERQAFLLKLADTLRPLADPVEVQNAAASALGRHLGAGRAAYAEVDTAGAYFTVHRDYTDGVPSFAGRYPLQDYGTSVLWDNLTAGRTNVIVDAERDERLGEAERSNYAASMVRAAVGVPLVKGGRLAATFFVHLPSPREWRPDEVELVEETAERTWAAVERAHAEQALRESEEKLRTLFASIDEMICILEMIEDDRGNIVDFRYIEANEEHDRQSGLGHVVGKLASEVVPGAEAYWFETFGEVARTGEPKRYENYNQDTGRWYDVFLSRVGGAGSRRVCVVSHDSTERKQREERQRFLLDFSDTLRVEPDEDAVANRAIAMLAQQMRLDRCYITVNRAHEDRADIEYQVGNDRVRALPDHIQPSSFPAALQTWRERTLVIDDIAAAPGLTDADRGNIAALGMKALISSAVRKGHGNPEWAIVGVSASSRSWTAGEIALAEEATERTWAAIQRARGEAALRDSEEKYRTLFDSIDEGFCIVKVIERSEGRAADYRLLEVNQAFERQTGLTNVIGKLGSEVSGGTEDHWADAYEKVVRTGEPVRIESHHRGTGRWYDAFMTRVGGPGSRLVCMVFQDTTERRKREERQRFLLALGDTMRSQPSAEAILEAAARLIAERLNPSRVLFAEFDETNGSVHVFHAWLADGATPFPTVVRQEDFAGPLLNDLRAGRILWVDDAGDPPFARPDLAALAAAGIKAALSVPLIIGGKLIGTLSIHQHEARRWTDEEVSLLQEVAERLWADVVRARAEAALRENEERLRLAMEAGGFGAFRWYPGEDRAHPDQRTRALLGASSAEESSLAEVLGKRLHPDDAPQHAEAVARALDPTGDGRIRNAVRVVHPSGEIRWVETTGKVRFGGEPPTALWMDGVAADVTESKRAEAALRESEERLRRVLETDTVAVLFFDGEGNLIGANDAFLQICGYTREQVESRSLTWQKLTPAEWHPASEEQMQKMLSTGRLGPYEKEYLRADGSKLWMLFAGRDLGDGTFVEYAIDVTPRRQAEAALRQSEERFRRFGEASQDILWIRDAETLQWVYLTPAFEAIYGLSREEALNGDNYRSWLDLILPEDREHAEQCIAQVLRGEQATFEYRVRRPSDGTIRWLRNTDFPITDGDRIPWIGGIGHDITELRESGERARLLLAELQHRVRNIMAMLRSVARRTGDSVETVEDYVQHLEGRISAMARTQALLTRDVHAEVDLECLIREELEMQSAQPERYRVTGPDVSLPPKAAEVLGLALHELATNAVKYGALHEADGRVDVRWRLLDGDKAPQLSLIWSEFGVNVAGEPPRRGFGTELITERVPYELQGTGTMEFAPTGLVATIEFPLADRASILQTDDGSRR